MKAQPMNRAAGADVRYGPRLLLAALVGVLLLWVGSEALHALLDPAAGSFTDALLFPSGAILTTRIIAALMIIGGAWYTQNLLDEHVRTTAELVHERYKLALVYDNNPDAILIIGSDFTVKYANLKFEELTGIPVGNLLGKRCHEALLGTESVCDACRVDMVLKSGAPAFAVKHQTSVAGKEQWVETMWYPVFDDNGTIESVVEIAKDITDVKSAEFALQTYSERLEHNVHERTTALEKSNSDLHDEIAERRRAEKALRESEERFRSLVELAPDLILVHIEGVIAFMNPYGAKLLGYSAPQELLGMHVLNLVDADSLEIASDNLRTTTISRKATEPMEVRFIRKDGVRIDLQIAATPLNYHGRPAVQAVAHDVTERKRAEDTIRKMAYYDMLTGLPNRALFDDRLAVAINNAERDGTSFAVMFLDMNDFKSVNDSLGHSTGDRLLAEVAQRLQTVVRRSDTVARIGGDEFTMLLPRVTSRKEATLVARKMLRAIAEPVATDKGSVPIDLSIGVAFYPTDGRSFGELMCSADMAMYASKNEGTPFQFAGAEAGQL